MDEEVAEKGEIEEAGDRILEFLEEEAGDFKLIMEGEAFFLNSRIAGE